MNSLELARRHPFGPLFQSLFEDSFLPSEGQKLRLDPKFELHEEEKSYLLKADLPGVKKEDVKVEINEGYLTISGERNRTHKAEGKTHIEETSYGSFQRVFKLPNEIDQEGVEASMTHGVLELHLPKSNKAQAKLINIA